MTRGRGRNVAVHGLRVHPLLEIVLRREVVHCLDVQGVCVDGDCGLIVSDPGKNGFDRLNTGPPPASPDKPAGGQLQRGEPQPGVGDTPPHQGKSGSAFRLASGQGPGGIYPQHVPDLEAFPRGESKDAGANLHFPSGLSTEFHWGAAPKRPPPEKMETPSPNFWLASGGLGVTRTNSSFRRRPLGENSIKTHPFLGVNV